MPTCQHDMEKKNIFIGDTSAETRIKDHTSPHAILDVCDTERGHPESDPNPELLYQRLSLPGILELEVIKRS
ncbi:hypothetical protein D9611_014186 [Ephemerocybe angulata]|uniref:Uncharacterized protein n=1 Tax=Ephemerocybe angulata TaxID=980116 RepID=A0A8H5FI51_9AGAR|nr:hypothetical protein D9611_014186 [Tulosesus angulatus]